MVELSAPPSFPVGLCVVGAGPVGLSVALEAARRGVDVLLLESGSANPGTGKNSTSRPNIAHVVNANGHAALSRVTREGLGGTTELWGGRCVPFEPVDFGARDYVPMSGWPVDAAEIDAVAERAADYLNCGTAGFHVDLPSWSDLLPVLMTQQERWSRRPHVAHRLGQAVLRHPRIHVLDCAAVTGLQFSGDVVTGVHVRHRGQDTAISAGRTVLACGGVKTTRLLLNEQSKRDDLFGGVGGPLGRFYAGHLTGSISRLNFRTDRDSRPFRFQRSPDGTVVRRRFTLSAEAQREHRLLNTSFFIVNPPFGDPMHRSGPLSLISLILSLPRLGRSLGKPETVQINDAAPRNLADHVKNVLRQPLRSVATLASIGIWRYMAPNPRWEFLVRNPEGVYSLQYHAEQSMRADNRIVLGDTTGSDGMRDVDIHFDFSADDIRSIIDAHHVLQKSLTASGRAHLQFLDAGSLAELVKSQATDGFHQIGTVRMSESADDGVVDSGLKVHGVTGLYVVGSAVFPTSGEANPTFMAVCLAIRLARSLAAA